MMRALQPPTKFLYDGANVWTSQPSSRNPLELSYRLSRLDSDASAGAGLIHILNRELEDQPRLVFNPGQQESQIQALGPSAHLFIGANDRGQMVIDFYHDPRSPLSFSDLTLTFTNEQGKHYHVQAQLSASNRLRPGEPSLVDDTKHDSSIYRTKFLLPKGSYSVRIKSANSGPSLGLVDGASRRYSSADVNVQRLGLNGERTDQDLTIHKFPETPANRVFRDDGEPRAAA